MTTASEARSIIRASVQPVGTVTVSLADSLGRILAEDIIAGEDIPPFNNSAMDGFALRAGDVAQAPHTLDLIGEVAAGSVARKPVSHGQAMAIMTGAPIPEGADAVVQQEWTEPSGDARVTVLRPVEPGHNVRAAGADISKGALVLAAGRRLRPQEAGALASLGKRFIPVYRPPAVAILATGDEIVPVESSIGKGQIRNSNAEMLAALVRENGGEPALLGIAKDDRADLTRKISQGLASDMLVTTGGVSVGKFDLVIGVLKELGVDIKFWKVNIKPGMPLVFGCHGTKPVFGLPGNPVSTMVTFLEFVKPALRKLSGSRETGSLVVRAVLEHDIAKTDGKRHFVRGVVRMNDNRWTVRSAGSQVSNVLTSLVNANCLIVLPEDTERIRAGEEVEIELL